MVSLALIALLNVAEAASPRHAQVVVRALGYDRTLSARAGADVSLAVVFRVGDPASEAMATELSAAFTALAATAKIQNLPIVVTTVGYSEAAALDSSIATDGFDVLFLCIGLDADVAAISALSRDHSVLTVGATEAYATGGAALVVMMNGETPKIVVNLPASKAEGAEFASDLLSLATVLR